MNLNEYLKQTQRLLRDARQEVFNWEDLRDYVNQGRLEIASRTQCVRRLTPISGAVVSASVTNAGSGYGSLATVTISDPDFPSGVSPFPSGDQATALAIVQAGTIAAINIQNGGSGYFQPQVSITGAGSGATAVATTTSIHQLNERQEVYNFSDVDLSMFPGVESVLAVKSVSIIYTNYRYSLPMYSFSVYQARIRNYPTQYVWVPTMCSQFGQGAEGSLYVYPLPSQTYQWEWDCFCLPSPLQNNDSYDVIPDMWSRAVPWFAASMAFYELQNHNSARAMMDQFDRFTNRYSVAARPGRATSPYGRW